MQLLPLHAFEDNFIWLLHNDAGHALVVDPGDDAPVRQALADRNLQLSHILLTHHHADHTGGSLALARHSGATVVAPHDPRIAADLRVGDGDLLAIEACGWQFQVLEVPGHTRSHVAYFGQGLLFSGDTLFSLGCGRLFEGTPAQMLASLDRLAALPGDTRLCCGHEYTLANAAFARHVDPHNPALAARAEAARRLRHDGLDTLPSRLDEERAANPFLRVDQAAIQDWTGESDRERCFAALRRAKDGYRAA